MASEFVRKVKGIRNIDILSPNITTENDLISTIDGEVYVATNKGYRKITGVETKEIKQLKTDVSNLKIQSDTNTLTISDLTGDIETNISEIETLKTSTDNNTSEIGTIETKTSNNESKISNLIKSIDNLNETINKLNEYIEVETFNGIDLMDKDSLNTLPLGVNYVTHAKNKTSEMKTYNGWLTVHYANGVKRLMFQPFSEGRTYYNYIYKDTLEEWL